MQDKCFLKNANSWTLLQIPASESGGRVEEFAFYKSFSDGC